MPTVSPTTLSSSDHGLQALWKNVMFHRPHGVTTVSGIELLQSEIVAAHEGFGSSLNFVVVVGEQVSLPGRQERVAIKNLYAHCQHALASSVILVDARGFVGGALLGVATSLLGNMSFSAGIARTTTECAERLLQSPSPPDGSHAEARAAIDTIRAAPGPTAI